MRIGRYLFVYVVRYCFVIYLFVCLFVYVSSVFMYVRFLYFCCPSCFVFHYLYIA